MKGFIKESIIIYSDCQSLVDILTELKDMNKHEDIINTLRGEKKTHIMSILHHFQKQEITAIKIPGSNNPAYMVAIKERQKVLLEIQRNLL